MKELIKEKRCPKCDTVKLIKEFSLNKSKKDGYSSLCKACASESNKKYSVKNKILIQAKKKQYDVINKDKNKKYSKKYKEIHKEQIKEKNTKYYELHKNERAIYKKIYRNSNKEKIKKSAKEYRDKNVNKISQIGKNYRINKREEINKQRNKRKKYDSLFRLKCNIRTSIYLALKKNGFAKKNKTIEILGCSFENFKLHLESKFEPWMTWDNYGKYNGKPNFGWDIDHIIPSSLAKTELEMIKLNHYTNLQPLCSYINRKIKRENFM